jgi:hypothetical protein
VHLPGEAAMNDIAQTDNTLRLKDKIDLLFKELDSARKAQKDEEKEAWRFLILAVSAPIAILSIQKPVSLDVDLVLLLMGACLVGLAVASYAYWLFLCVGRRQLHIEETERSINGTAGEELLRWEGQWNAYTTKYVRACIGFLFTAIFYSLLAMPIATGYYAFTHGKTQLLWVYGILVALFFAPLACFFILIVHQERKHRQQLSKYQG